MTSMTEGAGARPSLTLRVLSAEFAVSKLPAGTSLIPPGGSFASLTRTPTEVSLVCEAALAPDGALTDREWRALEVVGPLAFSEIGVLASLAAPLAAAGVSIFVLSTYDTDYLLVKANALERACRALERAGHRVERD